MLWFSFITLGAVAALLALLFLPDLVREALEPTLPGPGEEGDPADLPDDPVEEDPFMARDLLSGERDVESGQENGLNDRATIVPGSEGAEVGVVAEESETAVDHQQLVNGLPVLKDGDYLLALVTKETTLPADYAPADLKPIPAYLNTRYAMQLREPALASLIELWHAAEADGVILHIISAYRSYASQQELFNNFAAMYGEEEANRFSARPGQSEHQLGTTVDFGGTDRDLSKGFAQTPQGMWLSENAHLYGFAMSYMEGKEHVTGYIFEPWHFRYIGVAEAREWKQSGLTLNEYLAEKPQFFKGELP